MRCSICGNAIHSEADKCSNCGHINTAVKVLTPEERKGFQGITIDQNMKDEEDQYEPETNDRRGSKASGNYRVYNLNSGISIGIVLLLIVLVVFFVAVPLLLVAAAIITIGFFLKRIGR